MSDETQVQVLLSEILDESFGTDLDSAMETARELRHISAVDDLPDLLAALESERANSWTRELIADPLASIGGLSVIGELLTAFDKNLEEGHDNDSFAVFVIELIELDKQSSAAALHTLAESDSKVSGETIGWLLEFC